MQEDAEHHDGSYQEGELKKVEQDLTVDALRESDKRHWFTGSHGGAVGVGRLGQPSVGFSTHFSCF